MNAQKMSWEKAAQYLVLFFGLLVLVHRDGKEVHHTPPPYDVTYRGVIDSTRTLVLRHDGRAEMVSHFETVPVTTSLGPYELRGRPQAYPWPTYVLRVRGCALEMQSRFIRDPEGCLETGESEWLPVTTVAWF